MLGRPSAIRRLRIAALTLPGRDGQEMVNAWLIFVEWLNRRGGIQIGRAKYLLELLLADEQDGWQIAVENDIPYLLGPWRSSGDHTVPIVTAASGAHTHAQLPQAFSFGKNLTKRHTEMLLQSVRGVGGIAVLTEPGVEELCEASPELLGELGLSVRGRWTWQLSGASADFFGNLEGAILLACLETENAKRLVTELKQRGVFPAAVLLPFAELSTLMTDMGQDANWLLGMGCWATGPVHGQQALSLRTDYTRTAFVLAYQQRFFDLP